MIGVIYHLGDIASTNIARALLSMFDESGISYSKNLSETKSGSKICIIESKVELLHAEYLDEAGFDLIYFLSKHSSAKGISAFTVHPEGNWLGTAELGGKPHELSFSAPIEMHDLLKRIWYIKEKNGIKEIEVSYEATHHGPLLKTPSMFVELGGNQETINNKELAEILASAIFASIENSNKEYGKVVIGIGGTHYPHKFSMLAIEKGYSFAHMLPKYAIDEIMAEHDVKWSSFQMLEQAFERSKEKPESAVIEWKSLNINSRNKLISKLNELGIDYEKV